MTNVRLGWIVGVIIACCVRDMSTWTVIIARPTIKQFKTLRGTGEETTKYLQDQLVGNSSLLTVERVVLVESSVDSFIENLSTFTSCLLFNNFYEHSLTIPNNSKLEELSLLRARQLKHISASPNTTLHTLTIKDCDYRSILAKIESLTQLQHLAIESCGIIHLNLERFAKNKVLEVVNLKANRIATLARLDSTHLTIRKLFLDENPLQQLDLHSLRQLERLEELSLYRCKLSRFYSSAPVTLAAVEKLMLQHNNLTSLNLLLLDAPNLRHLVLGNNRLQKVPTDLNKFVRLCMLFLGHNELSTLDLDALTGLEQLEMLAVSSNVLTSIKASRGINLPSLVTLQLNNNLLLTVDTFHRWNLPKLRFIMLEGNQFTNIPPLHKRWPHASLRMSYNPLMCSSLQEFVEQILDQRTLILDSVKCPNGSVAMKSDLLQRDCCMLMQVNEP